MEDLKDIIDCIIAFDSTVSNKQKAEYFDIVQSDLREWKANNFNAIIINDVMLYEKFKKYNIEKR